MAGAAGVAALARRTVPRFPRMTTRVRFAAAWSGLRSGQPASRIDGNTDTPSGSANSHGALSAQPPPCAT